MKNQTITDVPAPSGFINYGQGPLKVEATGKQIYDVIGRSLNDSNWTENLEGWGAETYYALREGSEIARLNGLGVSPLPEGVIPAPDGTIFFGKGPLKVEASRDNRNDVFSFDGATWRSNRTGDCAAFYYALRQNSEIAKLNGLTDNTTEPQTPMKTRPNMKLKLQRLLTSEIQLPSDMVAFRIVEQEGFVDQKLYEADGHSFKAVQFPDFPITACGLPRLYLRGSEKCRDNRIMVIPRVKYDKLVAAIDSLLKTENAPKILYTATFFYKNEKNGSQKRRMIEVLKEDDSYLEGNDKDDNGAYKKFLKANVIGTIDKIK